MEYMLILTFDESALEGGPGPGEPGFAERMAPWGDYNRLLMEGGHFISGASLAPTSMTTTVSLGAPGSTPTVTDGPFAETKEQLGGYYTIRAADLDEALALAKQVPLPYGTVEVRPLATRPDGDGTPAGAS